MQQPRHGWGAVARPTLAPTPRDVLYRDGSAALLHFAGPDVAPAAPGTPVLIVPSLINRWYVVDLRPGASLVEGLVQRGIDVFCLDWGIPGDEDRYLTWDDILDRLHRAVSRTARAAGVDRVAVLGYCMGATLSGIYTALEPERVAAFINLLGPFDFSAAGPLANSVDPRWFDVDAIAAAGNVSAMQMQSGFVAMRPTQSLAKWVGFLDRAGDPAARESFAALEAWAGDNIPFPAAAYRTYIRELYQQNGLVNGTHRARGRVVDLGAIQCPVLSIVAERDDICPPAAACAINERCGSNDTEVLRTPGGHVGAVVGSRAATQLYPAVAAWLRDRLGSTMRAS